MPAGRPLKFRTPEELESLFESWQDKIERGIDTDIPDVEGFCHYIGAYRDLLSEYEKKAEFADTIKRIKNWIYYKKKQLAMQGKMNAAIFIFDAKNNAGYADKQEVDHTTKGKELPTPILGGLSVPSNDSNEEAA